MTNWRKILVSFLFLASLFVVRGVLAQEVDDQALFGGETQKTSLAATLGLSDADPRIVGANLIRIFLGFLGLIAVALILYAGWVYMKSQGNAGEIEKSKDILKSATIGLLIILSAFAIVTFILSSILSSTGGDQFGGSDVLPGGGWFDGDGGFYVVSSEPTPGEMNVFRDQAILLSFNLQLHREVATSSFFEVSKVAEYNLSTFETEISTNTASTTANNGPIEIVVSTSSDMTTVIIKASSTCEAFNGVSTTTYQNCLSSWSKYHVKIKDGVMSLSGKPVFCNETNRLCEFDFYTNDSFGEGRPVIRNITPIGGFCRQGTAPDATSTDEACLTTRDCQHWISSTTASNPDWHCDTVTPNAKAGNFVSISGRNFGQQAGTIEFSALNGTSLDWLNATTSKSINTACAGWTNTEIVAVMPAGIATNSTSSVRITTDNSQVEYNNDKFGPKIKDLLVNEIERPGLCQVAPNHGTFSSSTTFYGQKLLMSWPFFGDLATRATSTSGQCTAADTSCAGSVPNISAGTTSAFVLRGKVSSNYLSFHKDIEAYTGPMITSLAPVTGPEGQYVTVGGSGFGYATKGQLGFGNGSSSRIAMFVRKTSLAGLSVALGNFENNVCRPDNAACTKDFVEASFVFPPICSDDLWKNNQVIVKVPKAIDDGSDGSIGEYYLFLFFPKDGEIGSWLIGSDQMNENNALDDAAAQAKQEYFTADKNALLLPGLCSIRPGAGLPGVMADVYGEYFPTTAPDQNIYFSSNVKAVNSSWLGFSAAQKADYASTTVPVGAITGGVNIQLGNSSTSNPISFKVGACKDSNECGAGAYCCQSGSSFAGNCKKGTDEQDACYSSLRASVFAWSFSTYLSTSSESCSGFANANACMLAAQCPNSPGSCQSQENTKIVGNECSADYCNTTYTDYCKDNKCVYDKETNYCASSSAGTIATIATCSVASSTFKLPGTVNKKVEAVCNEVETGVNNSDIATSEYFWQYKPKFGELSCMGSSTMALGGWCTILNGPGQPNPDDPRVCSSCSDGFKCNAGKCVIGDAICPGNSECDESVGKCRESFTCECCCKVGNDAQDCCAGLTCTPNLCVNDVKDTVTDQSLYGQCTGCTKYDSGGAVDQEASNLACSCKGDNRYCNTEPEVYINGAWRPNPTGICQDRAKLDEPCSGANPSVFETSATEIFNNQTGNKPQFAYWRLDESTTTTDLSDSIRTANSLLGADTRVDGLGNINARQEAGCMSKSCLKLNGGVTDVVNLAVIATTTLGGDQTWSLWFKPLATTTSNNNILSVRGGTVGGDLAKGDDFSIQFRTDARVGLSLIDNNNQVVATSSIGAYPLDEWLHIVAVLENNKSIRLIVNNKEEVNHPFAGRIRPIAPIIPGVSPTARVLLSSIPGSKRVVGVIDEIQFYDQALDQSTLTTQTNGFGLVLPATYNAASTTKTVRKIGQAIAAGTTAAYWQSDTAVSGQSYLDYNGKYTIGVRPAICTSAAVSLEVLPGATSTCRFVNALTEGGLPAGYWQVRKPQGAPCPPKTVLAPASSTDTYNSYPWCTVAGKVNNCTAYNDTTSTVNGVELGATATCNVFSYSASSTNQAAYCSPDLPICQNGLQCDPNSCTCRPETTSTETSEVRAGEPCTKQGGTCNVGVPSCDTALTNLECREDGTNADCRCCCNPGDGKGIAKSATYPNGADTKNVVDSKGNASSLICLPNKGSCTGDTRGGFCGCVDDNQCNNGADGCGIDTCCSARPFATSTYPYGYAGEIGLTANINMKPVCRNTQISMTFNDAMDAASFTGNVIVAGDYGTELCPSGTTYLTTIVKPSRFAWFNRLLTRVVTFFVGNDSAFAQANKTFCAIEGRVTAEDSNKKIVFSPLKVLDYNRVYYVTVIGDSNSSDALRDGVLSAGGIGMHDDDGSGQRRTKGGPGSFAYASSSLSINGREIFGYTWHFKTKDQAEENQGICLVDKVAVNTMAASSDWVFTTSINNPADDLTGANFDSVATDSDKDFVAKALTKDDQPIASIPPMYGWSFGWSSQNTNLIGLRNHPDALNDHSVAFVVKNQKDAQTTVTAEAIISDDTVNTPSTKNKSFRGKANVRVFMCNNPWPPLLNPSTWPWKDSDTNCTSGTGCNSNNFEFYYCRDAGGPGTADDLPVISSNPVGLGKSQGYCESGYSYNQTCSTNDHCLEPEKGTIKCINKVCSGGTKLDDSVWPNAGGKCQSDGDCQASGNCKILLKEFFFGRDNIVGSSNAVITASSNAQGTAVNLSWAKTNGATKYKVYYGLQAGKYDSDELVPSANCNTTTCTATISNLTKGKTYYFTFTSLNNSNTESAFSVETSVSVKDTTAPAKPIGVATSNIGSDKADIAWTANTTDSDLASYRIYVGHASGNYGEYYTINKSGTKYTVVDLTKNKAYYFKVTAMDQSGNESVGDEFMFTTLNQ